MTKTFKAEIISPSRCREVNELGEKPDYYDDRTASEMNRTDYKKGKWDAAESSRKEFDIVDEVEEEYINQIGGAENHVDGSNCDENFRKGFYIGHTAHKEKYPYSEADVMLALLEYGRYIFHEHKGTFSSGDLEKAKEKIIASLSPKAGDIVEVELVGEGEVKLLKR